MRAQECALALALTFSVVEDVRAQSAASPVLGTWRGSSICTPAGKPTCQDEVVVYHVRKLAPPATTDSASASTSGAERIEIVMNKVVNAKEETMGTLPCAHAERPHLVACPMRGWAWTFELRGDTLSGTLANPAGTVWRNVRVSRSSRSP